MSARARRRRCENQTRVLWRRRPGPGRPVPAPRPHVFPLDDYHVHLNTMTLEQVIARSRETGVKYGLLEHLGTNENEYPIMLSNDKELLDWIAKLKDQGVYIGAQAEWIDWVPCFS